MAFPTDLIIDSTSKVISGTIYSPGDITLTATSLSGPVTFVAGRDLKDMSTSGVFQTADPYNGVVIFAGRNISLGGTVHMPFGLLYAPNGTININATVFDLKGSLVADQVEIKFATDVDLRYDAAFASGTYTLPLTAMVFVPPQVTLPPLPETPGLIGPLDGTTVSPSTGLIWGESR